MIRDDEHTLNARVCSARIVQQNTPSATYVGTINNLHSCRISLDDSRTLLRSFTPSSYMAVRFSPWNLECYSSFTFGLVFR